MKFKKWSRKEIAFDVWLKKLTLIVANIFKYENLPANLPYFEIEIRLIYDGYTNVFKNEKYGIMTSNGYVSGVNIYNHGNQFGYSQPVIGSNERILNDLIDGVIMYGTTLDKFFAHGVVGERLRYYADILSDIDVSKQIMLINGRMINTVIAKSDNAVNEIRDTVEKIINGELTVPKIESGVLDSTENFLKGTNNNLPYSIADLDLTQQNTLKHFYTDFGIPFNTEKAERLIETEIDTNNSMTDINIEDMLKCRKEGVEQINFLYNTEISVDVRREYNDIK